MTFTLAFMPFCVSKRDQMPYGFDGLATLPKHLALVLFRNGYCVEDAHVVARYLASSLRCYGVQ